MPQKAPSHWTPEQRLAQRTKIIPNGCHIYMGATSYGYGQITINQKTLKTHRLAWELANRRAVPGGLFVCHRCDNRRCVNPDHLFLGTHQDNVDDMMAKGRARRGVPARGSAHARAIIDEETATRIYSAVGSASAIGRKFGVARAVVRGIKNRTHWAHIKVSGPPGALLRWSRAEVHEAVKRLA